MSGRWDAQRIRFLQEAAERAQFHAELAQQIVLHLGGCRTLLDAGCGLGYLSLALAPYVERITAADRDENALRFLARQCTEKGVTNIAIHCGALEAFRPAQPFDAAVFCLFGQTEQAFLLAKRLCRRKAVFIKRNEAFRRFSAEKAAVRPQNGYAQAVAFLRERGVPFFAQEVCASLDQPLRSVEDARRFLSLYNRPQAADAMSNEVLRAALVETGEAEFPYLLPGARRLGMIVLDAQAL